MGSGLFGFSVLEAGEFETVVLKDGQRVVGEIIAERQAAIYVDLGYDILKIPRDQILRRAKGAEMAAGPRAGGRSLEEDSSGFYTTGVLKPLPIKELVSKFGEAVIAIETPSGKGSGFLINKDGYAITNDHVIEGESRISAILYVNVPGGFSRAASKTSRSSRSTRSSIWPCSSFLSLPI